VAVRRDALAELDDLERVFGALAHASRRHILLVLHARGDRVKAGDIARRFACSWPTTTRHLGVLADAGLVRKLQVGRERFYELERGRLHSVVGGWLAHFAAPSPARSDAPKAPPPPRRARSRVR
jgi:DNA-binding transcriptional ArsR family regulator